MTTTTSCPLTKREWKKEMGYFCIVVSQLPTKEGHRWDIWPNSQTQLLRLVDSDCSSGIEKDVIESCDIDTFRTKLLQLIQTLGDKGN